MCRRLHTINAWAAFGAAAPTVSGAPPVNFAIWLTIILLWLVTAAIARGSGRGRSVWGSAYSWFALFWLVQFSLLQLGLLDYLVEMQAETAIFIIVCHAAFAAGVIMVMISRPVPKMEFTVRRAGAPNDQRRLTRMTLIIGLLSQALLAADRLAITGVSLGDAMSGSSLSDVRAANFSSTFSYLGSLYLVAAVGASCGYVGLAMFFYNRGRGSRWTLGLKDWCLPVATSCVIGIYHLFLLGGRGGLFFVIFVMVAAFSLGRRLAPVDRSTDARRRKTSRSLLLAVLVLAVPLSIASAWFQIQRDGTGIDPFSALYTVHAAKPSDLIVNEAVNDRFLAFYLLQFSYLTSSSQLLNYYVPLGSYSPGPYFGAYNFAQPVLILGRVFGGLMSFAEIRSELFVPLISQGHHGNVWTTLLRDLYADFGYFGAIIFLFLFGATVQATSDSMLRRPTAAKAALLTLLRLICIWSAFHSLFFIEAIFWATSVSGFLVFAGRERGRRRQSVPLGYSVGAPLPIGPSRTSSIRGARAVRGAGRSADTQAPIVAADDARLQECPFTGCSAARSA